VLSTPRAPAAKDRYVLDLVSPAEADPSPPARRPPARISMNGTGQRSKPHAVHSLRTR